MSSILKLYRHYNHAYPVRVNLVQTGVLFGLGDVTAQRAVERREFDEIDWLRTVRYASIGCAVGPSLTLWYRTLDRLGTANTVPVVAKKILVDQLVASPVITAAVLTMSWVYSGDEWPAVRRKLRDNYATVVLTSYAVWPAVQTINFTVVPPQLRVLFVQMVSLAWNTYLSFMTVDCSKTE